MQVPSQGQYAQPGQVPMQGQYVQQGQPGQAPMQGQYVQQGVLQGQYVQQGVYLQGMPQQSPVVQPTVLIVGGQQAQRTVVGRRLKDEAWIWFIILLLCCFPLCWLPFVLDSCYQPVYA
jgi:hypothetical protein